MLRVIQLGSWCASVGICGKCGRTWNYQKKLRGLPVTQNLLPSLL